MKKLKQNHKKTLIILSVFFCFIVFLLVYSFYPVINYDTRYSQHVNHSIKESKAPGRILIYDRNGEVITDKMYPNGYYKAIKTDINSEFIKSLIKIEDKNYYSHYGINIISKLRAIKDNLVGEKISGASTITEQYIKNKYFKNYKRSYLQKIRESILALFLNLSRTKENILNIYYHNAYFGNQLYGVGAAIEVYFGKESLEELTQEEITILLSLLNNPGIKSIEEEYFRSYFEKIKKRLGYNFERNYFGKLNKKKNIDLFPFVTNMYLEGGDFKKYKYGIQSTIDADLQEYTKESIYKTLEKLKGKNVTNAAVFAMIPKTGEILIYQGSRDFYSSIIDGEVDVIQSKRQMGSTVKPFLYLYALKSGFNPDDLIIDLESEYNSFQEGKTYISENYSLREYGLVRFKKALGNSMNNATVRLSSELGLENVYNFYKKYGFQFDFDAEHYGYSLVLGNSEMKLETLVRAYSKLVTFNNPSPSGLPLKKEEKLLKTNKFLLEDILKNPDNRDISFGVNSILNTSILQAVKTGTSSDFRDNTIVSYSEDLVIGIWVGNNDNSSMIGITGITGAGNIWHNISEKAIELGYIKNHPLAPSLSRWGNIEEGEYCIDKDCFRKELIYKKTGKKYFSRIGDNYFAKEDLKENLSEFEENKLESMGIIIK